MSRILLLFRLLLLASFTFFLFVSFATGKKESKPPCTEFILIKKVTICVSYRDIDNSVFFEKDEPFCFLSHIKELEPFSICQEGIEKLSIKEMLKSND